MRFIAGGLGKVGGKLEGIEGYLPVLSVGVGVDGGGLSTGAGGRRRLCSPATGFRRGREGADRLRRIRRTRGVGFGAQFGLRRGGGAGRRGGRGRRRHWRAE